jgi:hypothetical protein
MNNTCQIVPNTAILSHRANAVLQHIDPLHYKEALEVCKLARAQAASYDALASIDVLVYEGWEILYNRQSGLHTNSQDPPLAWTLLFALGEHQGGHIFLPHLGL